VTGRGGICQKGGGKSNCWGDWLKKRKRIAPVAMGNGKGGSPGERKFNRRRHPHPGGGPQEGTPQEKEQHPIEEKAGPGGEGRRGSLPKGWHARGGGESFAKKKEKKKNLRQFQPHEGKREIELDVSKSGGDEEGKKEISFL